MPALSPPRPCILVFDSGLGGLSIVGELQKASLNADICYLADTAFFPYGEKSDKMLIYRIPALLERAVAASRADLVIIACNTASTLALAQVRSRLSVPVIGVVPAIKPAAALTKTGVIGLLATPNTVARPYTDQLIMDFASGVRVIRHGAVGLAATAEAALSGGNIDHEVVRASIDGLIRQDGGDQIDVIVLACTHYPHLKPHLTRYVTQPVAWVDSGAAIARRASSLLSLDTATPPLLSRAFTTGGPDEWTQIGLKTWGFQALGSIADEKPAPPRRADIENTTN
jgi:glutamate racemase